MQQRKGTRIPWLVYGGFLWPFSWTTSISVVIIPIYWGSTAKDGKLNTWLRLVAIPLSVHFMKKVRNLCVISTMNTRLVWIPTPPWHLTLPSNFIKCSCLLCSCFVILLWKFDFDHYSLSPCHSKESSTNSCIVELSCFQYFIIIVLDEENSFLLKNVLICVFE